MGPKKKSPVSEDMAEELLCQELLESTAFAPGVAESMEAFQE